MVKVALNLLLIFTVAVVVNAQTVKKDTLSKSSITSSSQAVRSSPTYAELLLRRTERESELEEFALDYTDEFPKVKEIKFELELLNREMNRVLGVSAADTGRLTLALGKLLVRKTEIETDLWNLQKQYNADHPEVKRAKRKIEVYEKAIKEILP